MGGAAPRFLFLLTTPLPPLLRRNLRLFSSSLSSHFHHRLSSSSSFSPSSPSLTPKLKPKASQHQQQQQNHLHTQPPSSLTTHPWPECSRFLSHISSVGYATTAPETGFPATGELSQREVSACLAFAGDRPNLLRLVSCSMFQAFASGECECRSLMESEYHSLAESTIHNLQEKLEDYGDSIDIDGFDIDYGNDVLTVKLGDLGTYVLNKQTPNRQIWLSSPVSGPSRFDWDQDTKAWIYRRKKVNLYKLLEAELEQLCGKPFVLS